MTAPRREARPVVLVTGAGGFLGRYVVRTLAAAGWRVVGLDLPGVAPEPAAAHWAAADLAEPAELVTLLRDNGVTAVIHAGGISGPMVLPQDPRRVFDINVGGTVALLEAMRTADVRRLVFCSSMDVYGPMTTRHEGERAPLAPATVYAASKAAAESLIHGWCAQYGLTAAALRLGWIYGPGRATQCSITESLIALMNGASQPKTRTMSPDDDRIAPYLYVTDAAEAVSAAVSAEEPPFTVMDVAGPHAIAPDRVPDLVERVVGGCSLESSGMRQGPPIATLDHLLGFRPHMGLPQGIEALRENLLRSASSGPS